MVSFKPTGNICRKKYDWFKFFGFVPDSRFQIFPIRAVTAEHLEDPTAYILQRTVSDGKSQKANIRINGKQVVTAFCSKNVLLKYEKAIEIFIQSAIHFAQF